ncbi:MAG TPA: mannose-1-phosphate guanylyltransferase/mannose-6-phosphate isomerase [bacterium]|nr:mannose-1-phosphate guanylyltransferase/mannose-6-phosphate isomerase [bacterium]
MKPTRPFFAVVLAGGSGTRLWPLSRGNRPKHLLPLLGRESLLQQTLRRLAPSVSVDKILIVTHQAHAEEVTRQALSAAGLAEENVIREPQARNTLPAVILAVQKIVRTEPQAVVGVFPSDHLIAGNTEFHADLQKAIEAANQGFVVTFGIQPTAPETGFGYLRAGAPLEGGVLRASAFLEKPDAEAARRMITQGGHFWNSGMFVFTAQRFLEEADRLQPSLRERMRPLSENPAGAEATAIYEGLPSVSIDVGVMEKSDKVAVVPASFHWSDLGSWESVYQTSPKNGDRNVVEGNVVSEGTHGSLLWSPKGLLAAVGLENMAVIRSGDAVLVCTRERAQDVKKIAEKVENANSGDVQRPWGRYTVLEEGHGYKIKRIVVDPHQKLSLQRHHQRAEHWVVIGGTAKVVNADEVIFLNKNESTFIPIGQKHRLENPGDSPLVIIEVQTGNYVGEDDIERFEDIYGRTTKEMS